MLTLRQKVQIAFDELENQKTAEAAVESVMTALRACILDNCGKPMGPEEDADLCEYVRNRWESVTRWNRRRYH